jgi:23S rRNA pseudouridine955/2504/2580 synthase
MAFKQIEHRITADDDGTRLDRFIRRHHPHVNQPRIEKLLRGGIIRLDGAKIKSSTRLKEGGIVTMPKVILSPHNTVPPPTKIQHPKIHDSKIQKSWLAEAIRNAVIDKGDGWIALNKPSGLATQGGSGIKHHIDGALPSAFPEYEKCRLVHRLDRDTSGVLIIATDLPTSRHLTAGFARHDHDKTYLALVLGVPKIAMGKINAPLTKSGMKSGGKGHEKMAVADDGQPALTFYRVLEHIGKSASLVALQPKTGRTHQLRAHMAALGCPILGDSKYGGVEASPHEAITRLCLHAAAINLSIKGQEARTITAAIPDDMRAVFDLFGLNAEAALRTALDSSGDEEQ